MLYTCTFKINCNLMNCSMASNRQRNTNSGRTTNSSRSTEASAPPTETTLRVSFHYIFKILRVIHFKFNKLTNLLILKFVDQRQIQMVIYTRKNFNSVVRRSTFHEHNT